MKGWFTWLSLIYCAELLLPDGSRANRKSTGTTNKTEAEKIVMSWIVNGNIPVRTNSKEQNVVTVDKLSLFNGLRISPLNLEDIKTILRILKERKFIKSAVLFNSPESQLIENYLYEFWDFEKSPYVKEKLFRGQSVHKDYCDELKSSVYCKLFDDFVYSCYILISG